MPEPKAFYELLWTLGMNNERVLWEDVIWMHIGAGVDEALGEWDQFHDECRTETEWDMTSTWFRECGQWVGGDW